MNRTAMFSDPPLSPEYRGNGAFGTDSYRIALTPYNH